MRKVKSDRNVGLGGAFALMFLSATNAIPASATSPEKPPGAAETRPGMVALLPSMRHISKHGGITQARDDGACAACYAGCIALGWFNPGAAAACVAGCADLCRK
jgi:hypothetical protein